MKCAHESNVLRAAADDRWTGALRGHVGECEDCAAAAAAAPWMSRFSRMSDRERLLPDPAIVWLKAQLMRGTVDVARISRPITIAQLIAYCVIAGGWAGVLTWKWRAVQAWIGTLTPTGLVHTAARAESLSLTFFTVVIVLASMTVTLALHTILAEE